MTVIHSAIIRPGQLTHGDLLQVKELELNTPLHLVRSPDDDVLVDFLSFLRRFNIEVLFKLT